MDKKKAIEIFGGAQAMADALGCSRQAVYQLPKTLSQRKADQVYGAAIRLGLVRPQPDEKPHELP